VLSCVLSYSGGKREDSQLDIFMNITQIIISLGLVKLYEQNVIAALQGNLLMYLNSQTGHSLEQG